MELKMLEFIKGMFTLDISGYDCTNGNKSAVSGISLMTYIHSFTRPSHLLRLHISCAGVNSLLPPHSSAFQGCTAADDKTAAVEDFLRYLYGAMARDAIWQYASEDQLQDAQMAIERSVMNRIFKLAFYPNQDGDILRDQWVAATQSTALH